MIRFAIVGYGNIGKKHASIIADNSQCELVSICDIDDLKKNTNSTNIPFYTDIHTMIQNENFEILVICTPNNLHFEHAKIGLENNLHVLIEKPVTLSSVDCIALQNLQEKKNTKIYTVMQNRFNPAVQFVYKLMEQNKLGKLLHAQVNCFWNRNENYYQKSDWHGKLAKDGGIIYTQFSHFIDIAYLLFGQLKPIFGKISNVHHSYIEIEDNGNFILETKHKNLVNFNYTINSFAKNMEGSITLFAEKATIKIGGEYLNRIDYCSIEDSLEEEINTINTLPKKNNHYNGYEGSMSNHDQVYLSLVDNFLNETPYYTSFEEGRNIVSIIENMYKIARV